jgi:diguanylate cyclase (GGDEF)-like protein
MKPDGITTEETTISLLRPLPFRVFLSEEVPRRFRVTLGIVFLAFAGASVVSGLLSRRLGLDAVMILTFHGIPIHFTFYPPIIFSGILTLWLGLGWGATVAYISTLAVSMDAGMSLPFALIFSFANPVGLFVFHTLISAFRVKPDLSDFRSMMSFAASVILGASASSSAAFLWALRSGGEVSMFFPLWQGWILNNVLYFLLIVGPVMRLTGRTIETWKRSNAPALVVKEDSAERITASLVLSLLVPIFIAIIIGFGVARQLHILGKIRSDGLLESIRQQLHYDRDAQDILLGIIGFLSCTGIYLFSLLFRQVIHVRRELAKLSVTDALTGLRNRRFAEEQLDAQFLRFHRYRSPYSVVLFDLDHFKAVNDRFGHLAGDRMLQEIARHAADNTRETDVSTRYGGEEFLLILPETDIAGARVMAERLRGCIEAHPVTWNGVVIPMTASFGVAEAASADQDPYHVVSRADEAMYLSKKAGRNRVT